jgi:hypothetical protein
MCYFQWCNTYYKCWDKDKFSNTCTEGNFGQVKWNDFGAAGPPKPASYGKTSKGQNYPIDTAIPKPVYDAVSKGFRGGG